MLRLFQSGNCGRLLFAALIAILFLADFAIPPLERYLARTTDSIQQQIYMSDGAEISKMMDPANLRAEALKSGEQPSPDKLIGKALAMEAKSKAVGSVYITVLVAIGFAGLVAVIWAVFARVRDIGWPVWVAFAVLSPKLVLRLFGADLPPLGFDLVQYGFFAALVVLALIPAGFGNESPAEPVLAAAPLPQARLSRASGGRFGRRGD